MIDLKTVRDNPDLVRTSQRSRGEDPGLVDALLAADAERRAAIVEADALRSEQKALGKQVGKAQGDDKQALLAKGKELAEQVKTAGWADVEWRNLTGGIVALHRAVKPAAKNAPKNQQSKNQQVKKKGGAA